MHKIKCSHRLEIKNLNVTVGGTDLLTNINTFIECNKITAIIGPNGAGKTTLLLAILGLISYTGQINFCLDRKHGRGKPVIGYVPQKLNFDKNIPLTVCEFLALSLQRKPLWCGINKKILSQLDTILEKVGALHLKDNRIGKLSGGELQRVLLAFALNNNPDIILLDEPASGIDISGGEFFNELISNLQKQEQFTLLLVSHDLSIVTKYANHIICLNKTIKCEGTSKILTPETISSVYGIDMHVYNHDNLRRSG